MTATVRVRIQGREYTMRSEASEAQIQRAVRFVEAKLAETADGRPVDTRDLTVFTLLNLAGEYLQLQDQQQSGAATEERLERLITRLDRILADNSGC